MNGHLSRMVSRGYLKPGDADLVDAWLNAQRITGLADLTLNVRARCLSQFCRHLPHQVEECSVDDLRLALAEYRNTHSQNSTRHMILCLGLFLDHHKLPGREEIEAMMPARKWNTKQAADMLSGEDIEKLIHACRSSRDRALVAVMYEGGFRPVELARLRWEDVKWDRYGAVINTAEKTGKPRYIRLIQSAPALAQWQQDANEEKGSVFHDIRKSGGPGISTNMINEIITTAAKRAGIKKRVFPYLLRHTRVTHLLEDGVPESVIKLQHWGSLTTPMLATYGHISNAHIDRILLDHAGIEQPQKKGRASPKPVQCQGCQTINLPGSSRCSFCGRSFTEGAKAEDDEFSEYLTNPDKLIRLGQFIKKRRNEEG